MIFASDDKKDLSAQNSYEDFVVQIDNILSKSIKCLKQDRFGVIVIGDVRNKKDSGYYGLQDDIKRIFRREGMILYNEMILITPAGNAGLKASNFMKYRKMVKIHQNILVFYKGDYKNIKKIFPELEVKDENTNIEGI